MPLYPPENQSEFAGSLLSARVVYASKNGVTLDGVTDQAAKVNTILATASPTNPLMFVIDGNLAVQDTLRVQSCTHIKVLDGMTVKMLSGAGVDLLENYNLFAGANLGISTTPTYVDHDITIEGGIWDLQSNGGHVSHAAQTAGWLGANGSSNTLGCVAYFQGILNLTIKDCEFRNPGGGGVAFGLVLSNMQHLRVHDVSVTGAGADRIHAWGPWDDAVLTGLMFSDGSSDAVALNFDELRIEPNDVGQSYGGGTNVLIDGVVLETTGNGVRLMSDISRSDNVILRNVVGSVSGDYGSIPGGFLITTIGAGSGNMGRVRFENFNIDGGTTANVVNANVQDLFISTKQLTQNTQGCVTFNGGNQTRVLLTVDVDSPTADAISVSGSVIDTLSLVNSAIINGGSVNTLSISSGSITNLIVDDVFSDSSGLVINGSPTNLTGANVVCQTFTNSSGTVGKSVSVIEFSGGGGTIPLSNVVDCFPFNTDFNDTVGAVTFTNNGSVTLAAGKFSDAATFNGSNWLASTNPPDLTSGAWSISFWVYATEISGYQIPIDIYDAAISGVLFQTYIDPSGAIVCTVFGSQNDQSGSVTFASGTWNNICACYDGSSAFSVYSNGTLVGTGTAAPSSYIAPTMTIGTTIRSAAVVYPLTGGVDDLVFFNVELNSTQVSAVYGGAEITTN